MSIGDVPRQLIDTEGARETRAFREWLSKLRAMAVASAQTGVAVLVGGTKVVANTLVTANSRILLTSNIDGGTPGFLRVSARTAGTSFTILSSNGADTSTVAWHIIEP